MDVRLTGLAGLAAVGPFGYLERTAEELDVAVGMSLPEGGDHLLQPLGRIAFSRTG
jgi:hypothetical protein